MRAGVDVRSRHDDMLRALHMSSVGWGADPLPAGRFFVPTPSFWSTLERPEFQAIRWVDAGAGSGELTDEALDRHLDMMAVDINEREGQSAKVLHLNALALPYGPTLWPLVCRPDHSGWCALLIEKALEEGASALYVGLECNAARDLEEFMDQAVVLEQDVGEGGERLWLVRAGMNDMRACSR